MSRRANKFSDALEKKYPMFKKTTPSTAAYCTVCLTAISIANKGKADLEQHLSSMKHKQRIRTNNNTSKLDAMCIIQNTPKEEKILAAEATLAFHIVKHHQSYRSCDCSTKMYRHIFNDSDIASKISSARTKTEAIINKVLAPYSLQLTLNKIETENISYIGVSTDGSNRGSTKLFPVVIQYFDKDFGIKLCLLELRSLQNEKSETICDLIVTTLQSANLKNKCIAFTADNCNTNFGGLQRRGNNNVFIHLQKKLETNLIGIGCPAHILNNCVQHALDGLHIDIESIILKIYNYFSVYTIRTEALKEFCDFVEDEYKKLLFHSKTRWLSLFLCVNRVLQIYPALQSYFLSQSQPPLIIKLFFENPLNESYLWFIQSLLNVFHLNIEKIESEKMTLAEIGDILQHVEDTLQERKAQAFLPLKVNEIIRNNVDQSRSKTIKIELVNVYERALQYLKSWTASLEEFKVLKWMNLNNKVTWNELEKTVEYLLQKNVIINDALLFDQSINLNNFLKEMEGNDEFINKHCSDKWVSYFVQQNYNTSSEFLKICSFVFAIPAQNANVERIFSMMKIQWTDEKNRLSVDSLKALLIVKFNFKHLDCVQFYTHCRNNKKLLSDVRSSAKYV